MSYRYTRSGVSVHCSVVLTTVCVCTLRCSVHLRFFACLVKLPSVLSRCRSHPRLLLVTWFHSTIKMARLVFQRFVIVITTVCVSGVEEILLLESTLRPDEVQFCSCCHCHCFCCCCCCWSRSKLKGYGFHLCLPPPIPVWYSFPVSFVFPLLSWLSLFIVRLLCFHFCSVLCQSPCWRRSISCDFF